MRYIGVTVPLSDMLSWGKYQAAGEVLTVSRVEVVYCTVFILVVHLTATESLRCYCVCVSVCMCVKSVKGVSKVLLKVKFQGMTDSCLQRGKLEITRLVSFLHTPTHTN
jgi:hypothetical protein